jgi:uncharacterized membrane protein YraQ (UPF0718 family)
MSGPSVAVVDLRGIVGRVDRVVWVLVAIYASLLLLDATAAGRIALGTADSLIGIAPYLLVAIAISAYAKASSADNLIADVFQGRAVTMIAIAALFGALSPFCSCGVIPLIAALLAMGVPLGAVIAFWIASPLMDPTMFFVTASVLGLEFAVAKTIAAIALGAMAGYATLAMTSRGYFADAVRPGIGDGGCAGSRARVRKPVVWRFWNDGTRRATFVGAAGSVVLFLAKWMALAFTLQHVMITYVPREAIEAALGGQNVLAVPVAVLVGIPAYLNGYAALGLVSGLSEAGMAPGAAMAFLLAGGVTSIPAAVGVWALARPPVFVWFAFLAFTGALAGGWMFQAWAG